MTEAEWKAFSMGFHFLLVMTFVEKVREKKGGCACGLGVPFENCIH